MPCKNILLLFAALFVEYGLKDSQGELLSMDELISYLLGAPSLFDPILWVILLLSALTGFGISWSKAKQLGVQYGEKNHLKSVWKTCFLTVFFISELIAVIRALFAAIRFAGRSSFPFGCFSRYSFCIFPSPCFRFLSEVKCKEEWFANGKKARIGNQRYYKRKSHLPKLPSIMEQ